MNEKMSYEQIKLMAEKIIMEARVAYVDYDCTFSIAFSERVKDRTSQYKVVEDILESLNNGINGEQYTGYAMLVNGNHTNFCHFLLEISSPHTPEALKEITTKALAEVEPQDGENPAFFELTYDIQNQDDISDIIINARDIELLQICENGLAHPCQSSCNDPHTDLIKRITDCYYYTQDEGGISSLLRYHVA
jgi:hypothetical protein